MTLGLVLVNYLLAVTIPNVKDAIAIAGATVNPLIGFLLPIIFYLKLDPSPLRSREKVKAMIMLVVTSLSSIVGLYHYISTHV